LKVPRQIQRLCMQQLECFLLQRQRASVQKWQVNRVRKLVAAPRVPGCNHNCSCGYDAHGWVTSLHGPASGQTISAVPLGAVLPSGGVARGRAGFRPRSTVGQVSCGGASGTGSGTAPSTLPRYDVAGRPLGLAYRTAAARHAAVWRHVALSAQWAARANSGAGGAPGVMQVRAVAPADEGKPVARGQGLGACPPAVLPCPLQLLDQPRWHLHCRLRQRVEHGGTSAVRAGLLFDGQPTLCRSQRRQAAAAAQCCGVLLLAPI